LSPVIRAETQHDPDLVGVYAVDAARHPKGDDGKQGNGNPAATAEAPLRQHAPKPILAAAQQLLEIRRLWAAAAWAWSTAIAAIAAAPRAAAARTGAPWATALTLPEHRPRTFPRRALHAALATGAISQASTTNRRNRIEGAPAGVVK